MAKESNESKPLVVGARLSGLAAPTNVPLNNGSSSLAVGNHFASGFSDASGEITAMHEYGDKILITLSNGRKLIMFPSGMLAEVAAEP